MAKNTFCEGKSTLTFVHQIKSVQPWVQGDISAKFEGVPEIWHSQELDRRTIWGHNSSGHGCHWRGDKNIQAASWTWAVMRAFLCKQWRFQCSYTSLKALKSFDIQNKPVVVFQLLQLQVSTWMRSAPPGASLSWNLWLWNKRKARFSTGSPVKDFSWLCHRSLRSSLITNKLCQHLNEGSSDWELQITPTHKWACSSRSD